LLEEHLVMLSGSIAGDVFLRYDDFGWVWEAALSLQGGEQGVAYYLGLDIGGTKCAVILASLDHGIRILDKLRFPTEAGKGFNHTYGLLCEGMEEIIRRAGLSFGEIEAIGVSCGGPLDAKRGMVLSPPNLPGWENIPLTRMLTEKYGVPAFLQNDANACALVEWKLGAGLGARNMIFLTMGTGMGAGVIAEGALLTGSTGMGGEVGHLRLTEDGPMGFGKAGSFEGYTSGGGIARQAAEWTRRMMGEGRPPAWVRDGHAPEEMDAGLMAEYARAGDGDAVAFFNHIGKMLGRGLSLLVDAFNPECIVIGSIFVRCEELLRPAMEAELQKESIPYSLQGLRVVPAKTGESLGDYASIMAALYAMDIDPMTAGPERDERVLAHFERLLARYPALKSRKEQVMRAYEMLLWCYQEGGKVMVVGNGGSCADAEHIVGELMKGFYLKRPLDKEKREALKKELQDMLPGAQDLLQQGLPAIALNGHPALNTAFSNDVEPSLCAAQQVVGFGQPGDVLIGISTSGNAKNVALAVKTAKALGISTLGLTGGDGGMLAGICDHAVIVPGNTPADVQELHLPVYHTLCAMLEAKFYEE
jgi:glucokinase